MPGARMLRSVTTRLTAKQTKPSSARAVPTIQASTPWVLEKRFSESGGKAAKPASEGRYRKLPKMVKPPDTKSQKDRRLSRGNATPRAPIWRGTM